MASSILLAMAVGLVTPAPHIPHAVIRDVAFAPSTGRTSRELVACMSEETRVLHSFDEGLSWLPLAGGGLDRFEATRVEYWPDSTDPCFVIGTEGGAFRYRPATGEVEPMSDGLPLNDRFVTEVSAAQNGVGPVVLSTTRGRFYGWDAASASWVRMYDSGYADEAATIVIAPDFDAAGAGGNDRAMFASSRGMLYSTLDGGQSWSVHPQFSTPTLSSDDFAILAIECAADFASSGTVVLSRSCTHPTSAPGQDHGSPTGFLGELWRSGDAGGSFTRTGNYEVGISGLEAAPVGPSGQAAIYATTIVYPDRGNSALVPGVSLIGILRSSDDGQTWDDFGNYQDFYMREADWSVQGLWAFFLGFAVSPEYATDGQVFFGRSSALFRTDDEGHRWRTVRSRETDFLRSCGVGYEPGGDLIAFGCTYGGGTLRANVSTNTSEPIFLNTLAFQRDIDVSPHFQDDGTVVIGGAQGNAGWFDPAVPVNNPLGATGWVQTKFGGTRLIALSPNFHANLGAAGSDRTAIWFRQEYGSLVPNIYRTPDLGRTVEDISFRTGGGPMKTLTAFGWAPAYDAASSAGRTGVYTTALNGELFRLDDTTWTFVHRFDAPASSIAVAPDWSRPGNPRLFVAFRGDGELAEVIDDPSGPVVIEHRYPGLEGALTSIKLHPDFAQSPVVYASAWGQGVLQLDLSAPAPAWTAVGTGFPDVWTTEVELAPDFPADDRIVAATQRGIVHASTAPGAAWTQVPMVNMIDDIDLGWTSYEPGNPLNPQPDRPFPWRWVDEKDARQVFGFVPFGRGLRYSFFDGSWVDWEGYGREFRLQTFTAPNGGTVRVEAFDYHSGALLGSAVFDLNDPLGAPAERSLDLGQEHAVRLVLTAELDAGEFFAYDGMIIES